jgi:hypothetical protein
MIFANALGALTLPTHEGSGQATHPSVIDFLIEHGMATWGGYRYWMVMTPYPGSNDAHEDPNLIASNDNINWVVPTGITNPLADAPGTALGSFHSDPDMIYNPDTNELWIYYRLMDYGAEPDTMYLKLIKVSEAMVATAPQTIKTEAPFTTDGHLWRSFSIWRESSTKWHMWGQGGVRPSGINYTFSADGINWSGVFTRCLNSSGDDPLNVLNYEAWHLGIKPDYNDNKIKFLIASTVKGNPDASAPICLFYAECPMSNLTLLSVPIATPVLTIGTGWDNSLIYKPSFVIEKLTVDSKYHLWYGAKSTANVWGIGYTSFTGTIRVSVGQWHKGDMDYIRLGGSLSRVKKRKIKVDGVWIEVKNVFNKI